jgi:D-inositol-3-phosphate glycosyltransferase
LKIIIIGAAYPFRGGIAHHTGLLYRELTKRHEVRVVTFKRQYPALLFPGKTQIEPDKTNLIPTEELIDSINPLNWIRVGTTIRKQKPELLVVTYSIPFFGPCYGTIVRIASRGTTTRVLFLCHNIIPHERRIGDRVFTRYALSAGNSFIVQSDSVEHDLLSLFPHAAYRKIPHPVYNMFGPPIEKIAARLRLKIASQRVCLFFGFIRKYKGLELLLNAMGLLKETDIHLYVVGECYEDESEYRNQVRRLGIEQTVNLHFDYVPNEEVGLYFSAADVIILPYLSATQSGIAQIAYNFDRPVIATRVGGLAEVVVDGRTGIVVPPGNDHALADAIRQFFQSENTKHYVDNVKIEKRKYTWEAMASAMEELAAH